MLGLPRSRPRFRSWLLIAIGSGILLALAVFAFGNLIFWSGANAGSPLLTAPTTEPTDDRGIMKIGRKLRELRLAENLSQGDIEKRTGLLRAYTSRVENGHVSPSIATLEKYAEALGVPLYTLFYDSPRRTGLDLKLHRKKSRWGAAKNQPPQYELFVKTVAGLNDRERAFFMYVANKLACRSARESR
jgi:transcriptional regulator with XRE-family HTH domain